MKGSNMKPFFLESDEVDIIAQILNDICAKHDTIDSVEFLAEALLYSHELPIRLRKYLYRFKFYEDCQGYAIVSGFPVDDLNIGSTPFHWDFKDKPMSVFELEVFFFLCGALLGDPFSWATQQGGYIVHNIVPVKEHENDQLGFSSQELLTWHCEDAFHPFRPDYVGLMCLRNPTCTATTLGSISDVILPEEHLLELFKPQFTIRPDESHLLKNRRKLPENPSDAYENDLLEAYIGIESMNNAPDPISVVFGSMDSPYIRIDPYFMEVPKREKAREALNAIIKEMDKNLHDVVLRPGDLAFIDNYRVVHGRKPFKARYDGRDRWLKRINITRDIRKSRESRLSATDRKVF